jgi:hypothetical protein
MNDFGPVFLDLDGLDRAVADTGIAFAASVFGGLNGPHVASGRVVLKKREG